MSTLGRYIAELALDDNSLIKNTIIVYPGRFQPFHIGHYKTFQNLQRIFGKNNVYIVTSDITEPRKSPFSFKEKKTIMTKMFGISSNKIVKIKNPYIPNELLKSYDKDTTAYITAVGEKDSSRLASSKYFEKYSNQNKNKLEPYSEKGYFYVSPADSGFPMSGTQFRNTFRNDQLDDKKKKSFFKTVYGKFDDKIYGLISKRLNEHIIITPRLIDEALEHIDINKLLKEASSSGTSGAVDDGPSFTYRNFNDFKSHSAERAREIGYVVVDYILDKGEFQTTIDYPLYPDGPIGAVSYGPIGIVPQEDENERPEWRIDRNRTTFDRWNEHVHRFIDILGWEVVSYLGAKLSLLDTSDAFLDAMSSDLETNFVGSTTLKAVNENTGQNNDLLVEDLLKNIQISLDPLNKKILLTCGGAWGHMSHPFDDMELTFNDLIKIVQLAFDGQLNIEQQPTEKTDGQNLMISWKDGNLISARNKGHLKDAGANAMKSSDIKNMFAGRGSISDAFSSAVDDLESAISKLSDRQKEKIFAEGKKFVSLEVIFPATTNVIPYFDNLLVFHGSFEYNISGIPIAQFDSDGRILAGMLKQINQNIQKTYNITGPPVTQLPNIPNSSSLKSNYLSRILQLQKKFKLSGNDTVALYHQSWWEDFISKNAKKFKYSIPNNVLVQLTKRWAFFDKSYSLSNMKKDIDNIKFLTWVHSFDKQNHSEQVKKNVEPFETIFLGVGADLLASMEPILSLNPEKSIQTMRKNLASTIAELRKTKDVTKLAKLKNELKRLNAIGGTKKIVPIEGLVFKYKGNTYKLSGTFAPLNQILGMLKF